MALEDPGISSRTEPRMGGGCQTFAVPWPTPWLLPQPFTTFVKNLDGLLWLGLYSLCTSGEKDGFCSAAELAWDVGHTENGGAAVPSQVPVTSPMSVSATCAKTPQSTWKKHNLLL